MAKKPRSPSHQARRDEEAKVVRESYKKGKSHYPKNNTKARIAGGKRSAKFDRELLKDSRNFEATTKRRMANNARVISKTSRKIDKDISDFKKYTEKSFKEMRNRPSPLDTAVKRMEKKVSPAERALAKQRIEQRKKGYAAKRAADTRTAEQVGRDLDKSTARLKNKRGRRVLKRNTEGTKNRVTTQKVGRAANTPRTGGGPGGKAGGAITRGAARSLSRLAGPVGAALTMGDIAHALNDTTSKGRSTGGRSGKFKTAQQQDADRAAAKHPRKK